MSRAELREAGMTNRTNQKNRVTETFKTVFSVPLFDRGASLKRSVNRRNFQKFASGFFEEKSRGETQKLNQPKKKERTLRRPTENE
jgi:hypothetical protein